MPHKKPAEAWQRGPIAEVPALLQPVAHALLQAREEVNDAMSNFPNERRAERPAGVASVTFHLQHLAGVIDRLFTYARNEQLTDEQRQLLAKEDEPVQESVQWLVERFSRQVDQAIEQLKRTPESSLTEARGIGRAMIPTTVLGLLFHAAEHTMRHVGQLLVTARVIASQEAPVDC